MATRARFLYNDYVKTATQITVQSLATGFSVDYLRLNDLQVPVRTTADANIAYTFDLGASYTIGAVAVAGHNITSAGVFTFQGAPAFAFTPGTETDLCESGNPTDTLMVWGERLIWGTFPPASWRYVRLVIADGANPDTYQEVGRIMIGAYFEPVDNWEPNFQRFGEDLSMRQEAMNGPEIHVVRPQREGRSVRFPISTKAELANWELFSKTVGTTEPFACHLDEDNRSDSEGFFARFQSRPELPMVFGPDVGDAVLNFRESI